MPFAASPSGYSTAEEQPRKANPAQQFKAWPIAPVSSSLLIEVAGPSGNANCAEAFGVR